MDTREKKVTEVGMALMEFQDPKVTKGTEVILVNLDSLDQLVTLVLREIEGMTVWNLQLDRKEIVDSQVSHHNTREYSFLQNFAKFCRFF